MDCDKCEETGLLYESGELPPKEKAEFEKELAACPPCDGGYRRYHRERSSIYHAEALADTPGAGVDSKIVDACARVRLAGFYLFAQHIKKSAVPVLFLALGLGVGFYAVYNASGLMNTAGTAKSAPPQSPPQAPTVMVSAKTSDTVASKGDSSLKTESTLPYSKRVGKTDMQGVVPVDVGK